MNTFLNLHHINFHNIALALYTLIQLLAAFEDDVGLGNILMYLPIFEVIVEGLLIESVDVKLTVVGRLLCLDIKHFIDKLFVLIEDFLRLSHIFTILFNNEMRQSSKRHDNGL